MRPYIDNVTYGNFVLGIIFFQKLIKYPQVILNILLDSK